MDSFTKSYLMFQLINSNQRGAAPAANNTVARMAVLPAHLLLSTSSAPTTPNLTSRRQSMAVSRMLSAQIPIGADLNVDDDSGKSPLARKLSMPATAQRRRTSVLITSPSRSPVPTSLRGSDCSLSDTDTAAGPSSSNRERPHRRSASCRHPSSRSLSVPEGKKLGPKLSRPPITLEAVAESAQPGTSGENGDDQENDNDISTRRQSNTDAQVEINISPASSTSRIPSEGGSVQSVSLAAITQPYRKPSLESQQVMRWYWDNTETKIWSFLISLKSHCVSALMLLFWIVQKPCMTAPVCVTDLRLNHLNLVRSLTPEW